MGVTICLTGFATESLRLPVPPSLSLSMKVKFYWRGQGDAFQWIKWAKTPGFVGALGIRFLEKVQVPCSKGTS